MRGYIKAAILAGTSFVALAGPVRAQDVAPPADQAAPDRADAPVAASGADIVVTGTRIQRDGYTAPTPVTVATTEDLARVAPTNIPDGLNRLPQLANSFSPSRSSLNFANSPTHGNILNLRAVGPLRTLILFDGIRVPATNYLGMVDTNVLPQLLVQRVDIVTGGASAAYGSDAVSGVVNFVLNRKFTGIKGVAQAGISDRGDNANQRLGVAGGFDFAGGRGHILLSGEYFNSEGMLRNDRETGAAGYTFVGSVPGAGPAGTAANPYIARANVRIGQASPFGRITASTTPGNPFVGQVFNPDGSYRPFDAGTATGSAFPIGGDGYTIPSDTSAVAPLTTYQTFARASYEVADDVTVYAQGTFARSDLEYRTLNNAFVAPTAAPIFKNNPYLPAAIASSLATDNDYISVGLYNMDGPHPLTKERTDFYSGTIGLDGKIGDRFTVNVSYTHGQSKLKTAQSGLYDFRKAYAALDVVTDPTTGNPVCRVLLDPAYASQYAGCQPLNVISGEPSVTSPAGYAYATGTSRYWAKTKQDSVIGSISGDVFDLPAGPVSVAVGAEYRRVTLDLTSNADPALIDTAAERSAYFAGLRGVSPTSPIYYLTNVGSAQGKQTVKEAFAEVAIPILSDTAFFKALDISAAGRITDYSTSGTVKTWKLGLTWKPVDDLLLRGTWSRDIRAPNLFELFSGDQVSIGTLIDPVSGTTANFNAVSGGNTNLKPEIGKTLTFGGVLSPSFLPGFSLAIDYYRLKITNQIASLSAQQIVQNCFNQGAGAAECALITRPSASAFPSLIRIAPANISFLDTRGVDFDASYRTTLGSGALNFRLYANYLERYRSQQYAGAPVLEYAGISAVSSNPTAFPKWRGSLTIDYSTENFGVTLSEQYIGKLRLGIPGANQVFVDPKVDPVFYTDLAVRFIIPGSGGNMELTGTVNNLFDKDPPLIPGTTPAVNLPTNIALYDQVGRTYTAGVRFKF